MRLASTFLLGLLGFAAMIILGVLSLPWFVYALGVEMRGGDFLDALESSPLERWERGNA